MLLVMSLLRFGLIFERTRPSAAPDMVLSASDLEAALPDVTSSLHAAALDGQVTIVRDGFGVPHIKVRASPPLLAAISP